MEVRELRGQTGTRSLVDRLPKAGGGGGYAGFQVTGIDDRKIFGGFEIFDSGFFWEGKFGKYFSG